jgi:hypothetical protein
MRLEHYGFVRFLEFRVISLSSTNFEVVLDSKQSENSRKEEEAQDQNQHDDGNNRGDLFRSELNPLSPNVR